MIRHADCLDEMAAMEAESVDAVVTDPPYDLTSTGARKESPRNPGTGPFSRGFMGKAWDGTGIAFDPETWAQALRVAKPSSYLLAFGGTRTVHRMACAIEDAGWIIRDMLVWAYASGFPKSQASLKPAWEPIVMARKPGPLRMLNIDAARIGTDGGVTRHTVSAGANRDRFVSAAWPEWPVAPTLPYGHFRASPEIVRMLVDHCRRFPTLGDGTAIFDRPILLDPDIPRGSVVFVPTAGLP